MNQPQKPRTNNPLSRGRGGGTPSPTQGVWGPSPQAAAPTPTKAPTSTNRATTIATLSLLITLGLSTPSTAQQRTRLNTITPLTPTPPPVQLRRETWSTFYPTQAPSMLNDGDQLNIPTTTRVELSCSNGTITPAPAGRSYVQETCPDTPRAVRNLFGVSDTWSALDNTVPYVISPWREQILTPTPSLRWNPVDGAQTYTITLEQQNLDDTWSQVWQITHDEATSPYPSNQPELTPGEVYRLVITTDTGVSSLDDGSSPPGFSLIGADRDPAVAAIAQVNETDASQVTKTAILVEEIYPNFRLFSQGVNDLLDLIESDQDSAQVHRLLGDYYLRLGLAHPAEQAYLNALPLAIAAGQLEEQVRSEWGLGTLYSRTARVAQAQQQLACAQLGATALGDEDLLGQIEAAIARLAQRSGDISETKLLRR